MARKCRECGSENVKMIGVDDCLIEVECELCGEVYCIEPDGFGEAGEEWVEAMVMKLDGQFD